MVLQRNIHLTVYSKSSFILGALIFVLFVDGLFYEFKCPTKDNNCWLKQDMEKYSYRVDYMDYA